MIIYPSIDKLVDKINSKYSICSISAKRANDLQRHQNPMLEHYESPKYIGQALEEIVSSDLVIDPESLSQN